MPSPRDCILQVESPRVSEKESHGWGNVQDQDHFLSSNRLLRNTLLSLANQELSRLTFLTVKFHLALRTGKEYRRRHQ